MSSPAAALYKALHRKRSYTKLYWDVANEIGIYEALLIEIVERWCELNQEKERLNYYYKGEWWTCASYEQWAQSYPALGSPRSIQRIFLKLAKDDYIFSCQASLNKGDPTKYYRVNAEAIGELLLKGNSSQTLVPNSDEGFVPKVDEGLVPKVDELGAKSGRTSYRSDQLIRSEIPPISPMRGKEENQEQVNSLVTKSLDEQSSCDSKQIIAARDNNDKRPRYTPQGDKHFGAVRQETYQRSLAAKLQRAVVPIEEMQPWGNAAVFKAFEAYLLAEAKKWKCDNPASYVAKKLQDISTGKAPKTEFEQWQTQQKAKATPLQQVEPPALSPEQEAWIAIMSQLEQVSEFIQVDIKTDSTYGGWYVRTNISTPQGSVQGSLDSAMQKLSLSAIQIKFAQFYPECHQLAKKKFPHLTLPAPIEPHGKAG